MDYKEKVIALLKSQELSKEQKEKLENIFPELKESEDEKIRKSIIAIINNYVDNSNTFKPKMIAWLEKQGEKKLTDKIEPKFKIGDWCIDNEDGVMFKIVEVLDNTYIYETTEGKEYSCTHYSLENDAKLWTIQDAKPGDVIYLPNGNNEYYFFIFKGIENAAVMSFVHFYQYNDSTSKVEETLDRLSSVNDVFQPATKEQRNILFQKIKEAGYEWDAEKKELKKIENRPILSDFFNAEYERGKADALKCIGWSEEDNKWIENLIQTFEDVYFYGFNQLKSYGVIDWLKSIKQRIGG